MFKLMKNPEGEGMLLHVWVKDRYRMIWVDAFFLMFWEAKYMQRPMSVGPYLYAKFYYIGEEICINFFDDDFGIVSEQMPLPVFQGLLRQAYDEVRKYDLNKLSLKRQENGVDNLFGFPGSMDALFHYMNLKKGLMRAEGDAPVPFDFEFVEPYNFDTEFVIKVGDSQYSSFLSDCITDFNDIRLSLEKMTTMYIHHDGLRLFFEDSPALVRLERIRSPWYAKSSEEKVIVSIMPDEFYHGPLLCGVCKKREVLSFLYLGFLRLCITPSTGYNDDGHNVSTWDDFRLATYNKLQSCVIENYVLGAWEEEGKTYPRQRWMSSVEEMEKDYAMLCEKLKEVKI